MTKTKTLTVAKARNAAIAYEQMADFLYGYGSYDCNTREGMPITKVKARFRAALGLPEDFRLTDKRMNNISDDLACITDSYTAKGRKLSVQLLADTLYTLKWPTEYAMPLETSLKKSLKLRTLLWSDADYGCVTSR